MPLHKSGASDGLFRPSTLTILMLDLLLQDLSALFDKIDTILKRLGGKSRVLSFQLVACCFLEALRREGCTSLKKVRFAVLENDVTITVACGWPEPAKAVKP